MVFLRKIALLLLSVCAACPLYARNELFSQGVDPQDYDKYLKQVSRHLDKVRKTENRPTVALVLCGGGAKGAAEVGAMKYIDELGIPIDFVCGTSIGSLIGGLYSVGYSVTELDSLFRNQDWSALLSDKIDQEYVPINARLRNSKYQLNVPFSFGQKILSRIKHKEYNLSMTSSLPAGYVNGVNVNNLFSALTVGYHDSLSFSSLPVPFSCVATELVSCKAKYWGNGVLKTAMRSSMGIPVLFKPVRIKDMILVDGGTRNNFPVDIAKSVGADIIIGVDISDPLPSAEEINNVGTILWQFVNMLSETSHDRQVEMTGVYIRPELNGYSAMSFNPVAVDTLLSNGYNAALEHEDELLEIRKRTGKAKPVDDRKKALNLYENEVSLSEISFEGLNMDDSKVLLRKTGLDIKEKVTAKDIEEAIQIIRGTGAVESVTYSLLGREEPYRLVFDCLQTPANMISVGARIDSEIWAEIALNLGININKISGPKLDVNVNLGQSQKADVKLMLDYSHIPTLNFEASVSNINGFLRKFRADDIFSPSTKYSCNYFSHEEKIYLSSNKWGKFDLKGGLRNRGYIFNEDHAASEAFIINNFKGNYLGCFIRGELNTMDGKYFPNSGADFSFGIDYDFLKSGIKTFKPITTFAADLKFVIPCGEYFAVIPDIHCRSVFDKFANISFSQLHTNSFPEYSMGHRLFLGGDVQGRYIENQIPFVGFSYITDCSSVSKDGASYKFTSYNNMAVINLDFRAKIYKDLYLSALGGFARMSSTLPDFIHKENSQNCIGAGLQLSYDSLIGPVKGSVNWSDRQGEFKDDLGFYLSIGVIF